MSATSLALSFLQCLRRLGGSGSPIVIDRDISEGGGSICGGLQGNIFPMMIQPYNYDFLIPFSRYERPEYKCGTPMEERSPTINKQCKRIQATI